DVENIDERTVRIIPKGAVVFTNWLWLKHVLSKVPAGKDVVLDLSETKLVDHTVMEKLDELQRESGHTGRKFLVEGLGNHAPMSSHPHAARKKPASLQRAAA